MAAVLIPDAARIAELCVARDRPELAAHRAAIRDGERKLRDHSTAPATRIELADHYIAVSHYKLARQTLQPLVEERLNNVWHARAWARLGWIEFHVGTVAEAATMLDQAVSYLQPTDHHADLAEALRWRGVTQQSEGDLQGAIDTLLGALAAAVRDVEKREVMRCLSDLGIAHRMAGEYRRAVEFHTRCVATACEQGARNFEGRARLNLAGPRYHLGAFEAAHRSARDAMKAFDDTNDGRGVGLTSVLLSRIARHFEDAATARAHADVALRIGQETNFKRLEVLALEEVADNHLAQGNPIAAVTTLETAHRLAVKIAPKGDLVYEISWRLSRACRSIGQISRARQLAESAAAMASATADVLEHALSKQALALVRFDLGYRDDARQIMDEVIDTLRRLEAAHYLAQAHEIAATFALEGDADNRRAIVHLHEAIRLYSRTGVEPAVEAAEARLREVEEAAGLPPRRDTELPGASGTVIAVSSAMRDVVSTARTLAEYDNAVLIEGPTGSGKAVIARLIHSSGPWADRSFTTLNCAALPMHLLESELFGHRRGAFTGAERDHIGHLEAAGDGIVFLDELDKTNKVFQSKLLHVLEDREFYPVGETEPRPFRARILCACNRSLRQLIDTDVFLPDLYFRLAASRIEIPPLWGRPEDVEALTEAYLDQCAERFGVRRPEISREVRVALMAYEWPGNVRELKNVIELAAFYARGERKLRPEHLPPEIANTLERGSSEPLSSHIEDVERREIDLAMRKAAGSRTDAAKILGVSRKGLLDRLRRLRIEEW